MKILNLLIPSFIFCSFSSTAQFSENFDQNTAGLSANCWILNQINYTTTSSDVINGTGSAYTNPPTSSTGERTLATPFLNVTSTTLTVSFLYKTSSKISGNATRTLNIGITDRNGNFILLEQLTMDKNSPTTVLGHNATYTIPASGVYRLEIRIGGATGDGNSRVIFDDLNISASPYYGPTNYCNQVAVAVNDTYTTSSLSLVSGNVLTNDQIPSDNEVYTPVVVSAPSQGTLLFNADGTFTYTPDINFTGGTITFTYQINDNGYPMGTSNIAMVSLNFPAAAILPVTIISFSGNEKDGAAVLSWDANDVHEGNFFDLEKSLDGSSFFPIARVKASIHITRYVSIDKAFDHAAYYRLKTVNMDLTVDYTKTVLIKKSGLSQTIGLVGNPVTSVLKINNPYNTRIEGINIFSVSGVKVMAVKTTSVGNGSMHSVNVQALSAGTYIVTVQTETGRQAIKFIKN